MACNRCHDLCITYPIRTPGELRKAIVVAAGNVKDDTIEEVLVQGPVVEPYVPFDHVVTETASPDVLAYRFRCKNCGEVFSLTAETYHGSGGSWHPERESASRETF